MKSPSVEVYRMGRHPKRLDDWWNTWDTAAHKNTESKILCKFGNTKINENSVTQISSPQYEARSSREQR